VFEASSSSSFISSFSVVALLLNSHFFGGSFADEGDDSTPFERCSFPESKNESEGSVN
jgi:hypothetical protein